jgi:hypothetical protein
MIGFWKITPCDYVKCGDLTPLVRPWFPLVLCANLTLDKNKTAVKGKVLFLNRRWSILSFLYVYGRP